MGDTEETVAHQAVEVNENEVVNVENDQQDQQQQSKDGEEVGDEEGKKRKPMAPRSDVWEHFSKIKLDNGEERAKCKYCGKQLDDFRTSLTPSMVERLVCTNDWLRRNNYINVEEDTEALAKLEEEIGALAICSKDSTTATAS